MLHSNQIDWNVSLTTLLQKTPMELVSWAILIGILAIPELIFVVHMISEHWVSGALGMQKLCLDISHKQTKN